MDQEQLDGWIRRYRVAWESNDPDEIGALYAEDAEYRMRPYLDPVVGRERLVADWLERADQPGDTEFDYEILAVTPEAGFVRCRTAYPSEDEVYHNLWMVRLGPDCRATEFTEWWMLEQPH